MSSVPVKGWDFRTFLALLMAAVATFGALTAYRAALAEDDVSGSTRLFDEGQILELDKRQRYLDEISLWSAYNRETNTVRRQAKERTQSPLDRLAVQEDLAVARVAQRYANYYLWDQTGYSLEGEIERWTANDLGNLGFNVTWLPSYNRSPVEPDIWANQRAEIKSSGAALEMLTAAVVLFVLTLLCLTLADLVTPHRRKGWLIVGLVCIGAAGILVLIPLHDPITILVAILGLTVVVALSVKLFSMTARSLNEPATEPRWYFIDWLRTLVSPPAAEKDEEYDQPPAELEPTGYIGSRVLSRPTHGIFSRSVVVTIAIAAVLSAFCGFLYSRAAGRMNDASSAAVGDQAMQLRESTRSRVLANFNVGDVARVQEDEARADAIAQAMQLSNEHALHLPADVIAREDALRAAIYKEELKTLTTESPLGSDLLTQSDDPVDVARDPRFPSRIVENKANLSSDRAFAMWDADNQLAVAYQRQMSIYLAGLTMFAIALYLLGQSLGIGGFLATRILALAATMFALVGAVIMLLTASTPVAPAQTTVPASEVALPAACSDQFKSYEPIELNERYQAAKHYACGRHLDSLAREPADYQAAAAQFAIALAYRPNFAIARAARAAADSRGASPQRNADYASLPATDMDKLGRDVDEQRLAVEQLRAQGFDNPSLISDLGYNLYVRGLLKSSRSDVEAGAKLIDDGLVAYKRYAHTEGWAVLNQALVFVALGRFDEAEARYKNLAAQRPNLTEPAMALGAMTDLEFLKANCKNLLTSAQCTELSSRMPGFKAEITSAVEAWWPKPVSSTQTIGKTSVVTDSAQVTPGAAAWRAHVAGAAPGEQLLAVWYRRDPTWHVWVALPELQEAPTTIDADGHAAAFGAALPATNFQTCLEGGDYRLEFYRQGQRAGRASATNALYNYVPNFDARLNLAVCTPPDWKRNDQTSQAGTATLMYPPGHAAGLLLARRDDPEPATVAGADSIASGELSEIMRAAPLHAPNDDAGCAPPVGWHRTWYTIRGHSAIVQTKVDSDGEIYEGFFVGPAENPDPAQCAIASSLVELP
jgi:hypothetical protein